MIKINREIKDLIKYGLEKELIDKRDTNYVINKLLEVLELDLFENVQTSSSNKELEEILENIRKWAIDQNIVKDDSIEELDLFDTRIMGQLVKMPSEIEKNFFDKYKESPKEATDYYYKFSQDTNYIRRDRIKKDVKWTYKTKYGTLDLTINLSKPEKDPRSISKAKVLKTYNYPKCVLCKENEGYYGRIGHSARANHRIISLKLGDENWFLQYSPYIYYKEHCIVLKENHDPMKISKKTFKRLLEFVKIFPHYFLGSNADLPIVGGSILSHDHFQGGNYSFAMSRAKEENHILFKNGVETSTLDWPMNVIRLKSKDIDHLVDTAYHIFERWKLYNDKEVSILSHTDNEEHNTITLICKFENGLYYLDLVLRNNRTTKENPYGIFHPREKYHHIKKENIGLIEVMGLAVLPGRLKKEIELLKEYILDNDLESIKSHKLLDKHYQWAKLLMKEYKFSKENISLIFENEIAKVFLSILKDAGVFKDTKEGKLAYTKCRDQLFMDL